LIVRGYFDHEDIDEETRLQLLVGLRLAGQLLGIDQGKLSKDGVLKASQWILDHRAPGTAQPQLDYDGWVRDVEKLRKEDAKLRAIYKQAGDIVDARAGLQSLEIGAWVWWPHVDGHIGLISGGESRKFKLLYEVNKSKTISAGYMVKVGDGRAAG
jgi:hypothetical protein